MDINPQAESTQIVTSSENHRKPATIVMVKHALKELLKENRKGVSLFAIRKFISETYNLTITTARKQLINKYLRSLFEQGTLVNITGRKLNGHFKYVTAYTKRDKRDKPVTPVNAANKKAAENLLVRAPLKNVSGPVLGRVNSNVIGTPQISKTQARYTHTKRSLNLSESESDAMEQDTEWEENLENVPKAKKRLLLNNKKL